MPSIAALRRPMAVAAIGIVFLGTLPADGETLLRPSPYYPLDTGNTWRYRTNAGTVVTVRVVKHETVNDVECARLEATQGTTTKVEYLSTLKDGLFRYQAGAKRINPPMRLLEFPINKGTTWKVKSNVKGMNVAGTFTLGEEEVTVPKGKFKTVTIHSPDFRLGNRGMRLKYWFAPNVGMVKQSLSFAGVEIVLELEEYRIAR